jgi:lysosomal acid lipase/cholesteryl ester hydrolase
MAVQLSICLALLPLLCLVHGKPTRLGLDPEVNYSAVSMHFDVHTSSDILSPSQIELITSKGYPAEAHWVTTPDGYILGLHRIPGPRSNKSMCAVRLLFV